MNETSLLDWHKQNKSFIESGLFIILHFGSNGVYISHIYTKN